MKKFNCSFCRFQVRKDYNLIKHYKKKHNINFNQDYDIYLDKNLESNIIKFLSD